MSMTVVVETLTVSTMEALCLDSKAQFGTFWSRRRSGLLYWDTHGLDTLGCVAPFFLSVGVLIDCRRELFLGEGSATTGRRVSGLKLARSPAMVGVCMGKNRGEVGRILLQQPG